MIKQSDIQGRLRLFRFGIVAVVVTAFVASMATPIILTYEFPEEHAISLVEALLPATVIALLAGLIGFMMYFAYSQTLRSIYDDD